MNYFAYGSNMNLAQMKSRCPGARKIRNGSLNGYEICFPTKSSSRLGKGVASVCEKIGAYVEGVLFELTDSDWKRLDKFEDVPNSYVRKAVTISLNDGGTTEAETYVANPMEGGVFKPSKEYMDLIIHGAEENELSKNYIEFLREIECEDE